MTTLKTRKWAFFFWKMGRKYTINKRSFLHHNLKIAVFDILNFVFSFISFFALSLSLVHIKNQTINILAKLHNQGSVATLALTFVLTFHKTWNKNHAYSICSFSKHSGNVGGAGACEMAKRQKWVKFSEKYTTVTFGIVSLV